jgi:hypothetical protein
MSGYIYILKAKTKDLYTIGVSQMPKTEIKTIKNILLTVFINMRYLKLRNLKQ